MIKNKNIQFAKEVILKYLVQYTLGLLIRRNAKYITFYCRIGRNNELFMHNTKYLFLYLNNIENKYNYKINWLCNDQKMLNYLHLKGYNNVRSTKSLSGIYYALKSKYWIHNFAPDYLNHTILNANAIFINLWHGAGGLKKTKYNPPHIKNKLLLYLYDIFRIRDNYNIIGGESDVECFKIAFGSKDNQIKKLGYPRLDVLYSSFKDAELFMEEDYYNIKKLKESGKKIIMYMPTHREYACNLTQWQKNIKLKLLLKRYNAILISKLHFIDDTFGDFNFGEEFYKMNNCSDAQVILNLCDILITDYSSVYFDYLLLDRPIIYFPFDYDIYTEKCHDFYAPYDTKIAGIKAMNDNDLLNAIENTLNGIDDFKQARKILCDKTFVHKDNKNCERIIEFIKNLDR